MELLFVNIFPLFVNFHIAGYIDSSLEIFFVYPIQSSRGIVSLSVKHQEIEIKSEIHKTGVVEIVSGYKSLSAHVLFTFISTDKVLPLNSVASTCPLACCGELQLSLITGLNSAWSCCSINLSQFFSRRYSLECADFKTFPLCPLSRSMKYEIPGTVNCI
jgi:hypothetical protein